MSWHADWQPPDKFGLVESQVYRSAFPTPASFEYLRLLGVRTVLNLSQELPMRAVISHFEEIGAELKNIGLNVWTHPRCPTISQELVKMALELLLDRTCHPLLVISSSGTHEVGTLVGCLRRIQQWNLVSIFDEYRSYAAPSPRLFCEQFIEMWDTDLLQLPRKLPLWFEAQQQMLADDLIAWREMRHDSINALSCETTSAYFCVNGPLVASGATTTVVDDDDVD
mmetsp:Transcript_7436/g.12582  ORF Transcript_7436/g.12582 Transcript_7436/m.12582 type:complete len:225 (-) Transcript_7436:71-745(-)|eukprot:CAMPEP_0119319882 /NCGR_PEP_ID=MMETSP1333-20130426/50714_1 /TAXON_ID=418940 /ORGANISM="Scyphosphaera apsteinii, Strain RCC1455" /LENGTH=224 /DNA_ID=CAMNT_0007326421 /DNA_START=21 /DNA_END=695 /DNA_ORIENTATION=+